MNWSIVHFPQIPWNSGFHRICGKLFFFVMNWWKVHFPQILWNSGFHRNWWKLFCSVMWMNWWTVHFPQIPWNSSFHRIYVNQDSSRIWSSISRWGPFWYFWKVHVLKLGCWNFAYRLDLFKKMEFIALEKMDYCGRCRLCNFSEWQEARARQPKILST